MSDFLIGHYEWLRALHIISVISWMAAMLYLPRLFVYHCDAPVGSDKSETFKVMERKLLKVIMNPAMIASWVFGLLMLHANPALMEQGWMHGKILLVVLLSGLHGFFAKTTKTFARDQNHRSGRFYRYINEIPAVFMILIVIFAVAEPF